MLSKEFEKVRVYLTLEPEFQVVCYNVLGKNAAIVESIRERKNRMVGRADRIWGE